MRNIVSGPRKRFTEMRMPAYAERRPAGHRKTVFGSANIGDRGVWVDSALCATALFALAFTPIIGTASAGIFLLSLAGLVLLKPTCAIKDLAKFLPLLAIPLLAMASTLWSDAPERTIRAGIQMFLTMAGAIIICRRISSESLIVILFSAIFLVCALSIPSLPSAIGGSAPLVGPFASKNAMAYAASLLVALSLAIVCEPTRSLWWRWWAAATIPLALGLVYLAQSAGALVGLIISLLAFLSFLLIGRVSVFWRVAILLATIAALVLAIAMLPEIQSFVAAFRQDVLHKDATLTGRTYLWDFAYRVAAERPLLGHGYYAFWRQGNIDAEGLWRYAGIASRSGFNFHNTFIEMRVDLGMVGLVALIMTCIMLVGSGIMRQFSRPSTPMAFLLAIAISELVRAFAETTLFGPFSYYTVLLLATGLYSMNTIAAQRAVEFERRRS